MARQVFRLTARGVRSVSAAGYHADGAGLYLQVSPTGTKSWLLRYTLAGRAREMGLGSVADVSLAQAREEAARWRAELREGRDPIEVRRAQRAVQPDRTLTFEAACRGFLASHSAGWRNAKHAAQWQATLDTYAAPTLGRMDVATISTADVLRCLAPIWRGKSETASRLRGRIEAVLAWADTLAGRQRLNPARWRGCLDRLLPARSKVAAVEHHRALAYADAPAFWARLQQQQGLGALALQFAILTAARSGEVRGATWQELDCDAATWTVPAQRMKGNREHRVPLSDAALALLRGLPRIEGCDYVFPSQRDGQLSDATLGAVLKRMGVDSTAHGFRSTFSTWCAEATDTPVEVREACLAHAAGDKVAAAYQRSDFEAKRRAVMQRWADYLAGL